MTTPTTVDRHVNAVYRRRRVFHVGICCLLVGWILLVSKKEKRMLSSENNTVQKRNDATDQKLFWRSLDQSQSRQLQRFLWQQQQNTTTTTREEQMSVLWLWQPALLHTCVRVQEREERSATLGYRICMFVCTACSFSLSLVSAPRWSPRLRQ